MILKQNCIISILIGFLKLASEPQTNIILTLRLYLFYIRHFLGAQYTTITAVTRVIHFYPQIFDENFVVFHTFPYLRKYLFDIFMDCSGLSLMFVFPFVHFSLYFRCMGSKKQISGRPPTPKTGRHYCGFCHQGKYSAEILNVIGSSLSGGQATD